MCTIEVEVINANTGETAGVIVFEIEISGDGSDASGQLACEWAGRILTAILNS